MKKIGDKIYIRLGCRGEYRGSGSDPTNADEGTIIDFFNNGDNGIEFFPAEYRDIVYQVRFSRDGGPLSEIKEGFFKPHQICSQRRNRFLIYHKTCLVCEKQLVTGSKIQLVHSQCREIYYKGLKKRNRAERVTSPFRVQQARSNSFINIYPCEACGYMLITKKINLINKVTREMDKHYLCPRCLSELRCGFLKPFTWEKVEASKPNNS